MEPREETDAADAFYVDSGLTYDGAPATVISGLTHLEGKEVDVVSDGNVVTGMTVASGSITLPRAASKVQVGLAYLPVFETLDIDTPSSADPIRGKELSVSKVILDVYKSRGGFIGPKLDNGGTGPFEEIKPRFDSDGYDAITLKTGKVEVNIQPQWSQSGGVRVEQRAPMPLAVLSIIPRFDIGG